MAKIKFLVVFLVVALCLVCLTACKHDSIKFYRESAVTTLKNQVKQLNVGTKKQVDKSSGVVIYKTNETTNATGKNYQFGPKDLDFDMPVMKF